MLTRPSGLHSAVRRCRSEWRCLGYTEAVGKPQTMQNRTEKKRVLIFIVAYNAERTIEQVLRRIPSALLEHDTEVLIIDDRSFLIFCARLPVSDSRSTGCPRCEVAGDENCGRRVLRRTQRTTEPPPNAR